MKKVFKILGITILVIFIILILLVVFFFIKSKVWANNFQTSINSDYLISNKTEDSNILNQKIEEYILKGEDISSITLTPHEVGQVIFNSLDDIVNQSGVSITNVYIKPNDKLWEVCALTSLDSVKNLKAWLCADVTKDNMQTAQLYLTDLYVEGIDITKIYPPILTRVNQGIAEALVTANENGFVGRVFENMELEKDQLIIKGSFY